MKALFVDGFPVIAHKVCGTSKHTNRYFGKKNVPGWFTLNLLTNIIKELAFHFICRSRLLT